MEFLSKSLDDTERFATEFVEKLSINSGTGATVVGLYGNLGSGKTTFVQAVAKILGVKEHLTSPTFVIMKTYNLKPTTFKSLVHIDAYRLKSGEELRKLGFEELLKNPGNLILIEWADLVSDILPPDHTKLKFEFVDEKTRKITYGK
jgi:tRNA threonylcarbamoyladenosine biosynthesis protein TsaE